MKKMVVLILLSVFGKMAMAQLSQNMRINADPHMIKVVMGEGADYVGSPFLFDDWRSATVVFNDPSFVNMRVDFKYNMLENELLVKNEKGEPGIFRQPVKEFLVKEGDNIHTYRKGFDGPGLKRAQFVEVLFDGSLTFIKAKIKSVVESRGYNTSKVEKKIDESTQYYFVKDKDVKEIRLNEKVILDYLQSPAANSYVKENKLNLKNENDVVSLLRNVIK